MLLAGAGGLCAFAQSPNSTYYNPILPGWHSDPSCTHVNGTFFCVTSTFISFPGLPIYASADLIDWRHISHAWNRDSQIPGASRNSTGQQVGMYAATLRYHAGVFHVICTYLGGTADGTNLGVIFKTSDPFDDAAWSDPVTFKTTRIDPDLFWDDDGTVYLTQQGIVQQSVDLETGELTPDTPLSIWNGTGGVWPEGPHLYKKDGYYYLLIAEGGTETNHSITIARSKNVSGPYEAYEDNPILTNRGTNEYFQTVGHGDLFQDDEGNWWGVALATRSGPEWETYPMGREAVLYPVTWKEEEWPILEPVRGVMSGWPLPSTSLDVPGDGPWNSDPDVYDFANGTTIPRNLVYWRVPRDGAFTITEEGLQIVPSRGNLTGTSELTGQDGLAFIARRQTDTLFSFSVDLVFAPQAGEQEAGVTVFLTQLNHIDLGLVLLESEPGGTSALSLRLRAEAPFRANPPVAGTPPPPVVVPVPSAWPTGQAITLQIQTANQTHYRFSAHPAADPNAQVVLGTASAELVSGGNGSFVGSLVGAYATCNGAGEGLGCPAGGDAHVSKWRYTGIAQQVSATEFVPSVHINR
ncbi:glycoside hydrolase family 43 protein [Truncatella angustata]|uniref:Glycoside hydrolase family 43 protein n=1 Tax=Truncatella angustata TaxID=152316 RepID=A0A9P8UH66_9PEZI|nr:glycoside hydrolase family 43 protein [Truncatella angustata]KAH6652024.1 glycoside hydrolase family 43 protein [Truncatella angustata]